MCFSITAIGLTCVNLKNIIQTRCSQAGGAVSWFGQLHYAHYTNFSFGGAACHCRNADSRDSRRFSFMKSIPLQTDVWLRCDQRCPVTSGRRWPPEQNLCESWCRTDRNSWQRWFRWWHHVKKCLLRMNFVRVFFGNHRRSWGKRLLLFWAEVTDSLKNDYTAPIFENSTFSYVTVPALNL